MHLESVKEGLCVICFDVLDALLYKETFKSLGIPTILYLPELGNGVTPALPEHSRSDVVEVLSDHVLITDHVGVRGMEIKQVIISIDPKECFLLPYVVEAITRCVQDLKFTVVHKEENDKKEKKEKKDKV